MRGWALGPGYHHAQTIENTSFGYVTIVLRKLIKTHIGNKLRQPTIMIY